jgi:hypothetical protein
MEMDLTTKPIAELTFDELVEAITTIVSENGPLLLSPGMSFLEGQRAILACLRSLVDENRRLRE